MFGIPGGGRPPAPWSRGRRVNDHVGDRAAWRREPGPLRIPVPGRPAPGVPVDRVGGDDCRQCLEEEAHRPARYPARGGRKLIAARGRAGGGRPARLGAGVRLCALCPAPGAVTPGARRAATRPGRRSAGVRRPACGGAGCCGPVVAAGRPTRRNRCARPRPRPGRSRAGRRMRRRAWRRAVAVRGWPRIS
jgi:hypothetical protein